MNTQFEQLNIYSLMLVFIFLVGIDQIIKFFSCSYSQEYLYCILNTGSAFGLFSQVENYALIVGVFGIVITGVILYFFKYLSTILPSSVLVILLAGIVSNSIDRLFFDGVRDMFHISFIPFFGIFNVADIYLTIVCIVAAYIIFLKPIMASNSSGTLSTNKK